jgi:hypothetical protein
MDRDKEIDELGTLFKFMSSSSKVVDGLFNNQKIRFTQPAALNDPLEFNPSIRFDNAEDNYRRFEYKGVSLPSNHDWYKLNLLESKINNYGILSLTDNPFSFEMWSHYANGHKGFLLEFKITNKLSPELQIQKDEILEIHKVQYVKDYFINIDQLEKGYKTIPFKRIRDEIFLRKTSHWRREREYRIIRALDECNNFREPKPRTSYRDNSVYLFPIDLKCINSVIFGVNTPKRIKSKIIELCHGTSIIFLQTILLKDKQNKMGFVPIDTFGSTDDFLKLLPQLFTADSITVEQKMPIKIESLNELPFYHLQKNDFDEFFKKQFINLHNRK